MSVHTLSRSLRLTIFAWMASLTLGLAPRPVLAQDAADEVAPGDFTGDQALTDDEAAPSDDAMADDTMVSEATPDELPPRDEGEAAPSDDFRDRLLFVGLRAGLGVPSLFNDLGLSYDLTLELGVVLPVLDGRLAISADVGYSAPAVSGGGTDARVGAMGGDWHYSVTNQRLMISLGPVFRIFPPGSTFVPYVGVLGRMYMIRSTATGTGAGQPFGQNEETSTAYGVAGALGGELRLGPGAALLEVSLGWANMDQKITGSTSAGELGVQLGYRIFL